MFEERMLECIRRTETPLGLIREKLFDEIEHVFALPPRLNGWQIREQPSQVRWGNSDECHLLSVRELFERLGGENQ